MTVKLIRGPGGEMEGRRLMGHALERARVEGDPDRYQEAWGWTSARLRAWREAREPWTPFRAAWAVGRNWR